MPTLTVAPNPIQTSATAQVTGSGFRSTSKVQLALDGSGWSSNYFRPTKDGTFVVGVNVSSTTKTQTLTARYYGTTTVVASVSIVVGAVVPPPPPPPPDVTIVPNNGLAAAIKNAASGTTLYLKGDYPISGTLYYGGTGITVQPAPNSTARIVGTTQSTLLYADQRNAGKPAVNFLWRDLDIVGANVLQGDSNGSSLVGFGPGANNLVFERCRFYGSSAWTGNTQHIAYWFGDGGSIGPKNCGVRACLVDGKGNKADALTFYHSPSADGAFIEGCDIRNTAKGVQMYDHPAKGIRITDNTFTDCAIGIRHKYSSGTYAANNRKFGSGTLLLIDGDAAAFTDGGGNY